MLFFIIPGSSFIIPNCLFNILGSHSGGVIPVPIPNTEVKPSNADDTAALSGGKVGRRQAFFCLKGM